jgi:hypothetical protein
MNRAERRRMERESKHSFDLHRPTIEAGCCDHCGRHLDDGPPGEPTLSVDVGGHLLMACSYHAPLLASLVGFEWPSRA